MMPLRHFLHSLLRLDSTLQDVDSANLCYRDFIALKFTSRSNFLLNEQLAQPNTYM